jgi:phage baseplate assembly protein gpV
MPDSVFQFGWLDDQAKKDDDRIYGVALATVINNIDLLGEGRVQVNLPWMPGYMPWARVAVLSAGMLRGTYFIPQIGDEVLVAFNQGDVREPFIIGSLWNTLDRPPALLQTDPVSKRLIRTPTGQQVVFDDLLQTVTVTNTLQNTLTLGPTGASLEAGTLPPPSKSSVSMDLVGNVTIQGAISITLKAPSITLDGEIVSISGSASTTVDGGAQCTISGLQIDIG